MVDLSLARGRVATLLGMASFAIGVCAAGTLQADAVTVGSVSTLAGHEDVAAALKSVLTSELSKITLPKGQTLIANASLTALDIKKTSDGVITRAVVSVALRDQNGNLRIIASGSGAIVGKRPDKSNELDVVTAAARGATKQLGAAIAK